MVELDNELSDINKNEYEVLLTSAMRYLTAGKSILTFYNTEKSTHLTYKIRLNKSKTVYYVSALCGTDNNAHYKYFGNLKFVNNKLVYEFANKATINENSKIVIAFKAVFDIISNISYLSIKNSNTIRTKDINAATTFVDKLAAENFILENNLLNCTVLNPVINKVNKVVIAKNIEHDFLEIWHAACCCRCGRTLTVKTSIENLMGAVCFRKFNAGYY